MYYNQSIQASSRKFTSPLEFNAVFLRRDHSLTQTQWRKKNLHCTSEVLIRHKYCNLYVTMLWLCHKRAGKVKLPKSWLYTRLLWQKIPHFSFSHTWGARFRYLPEVCPYMLMYSALHIMKWFSHILDVVTPKIRWKFSDFNIFMNQNKRRLRKTWSDR